MHLYSRTLAFIVLAAMAGCNFNGDGTTARTPAPSDSRPTASAPAPDAIPSPPGDDGPAGRTGWAEPAPAPPDDGVGEIVKSGLALYSQGREELIIRDFFKDRRGGFFLDVGCAHYAYLSTTYYLESRLGWSGIGVDALAEYGPEYVEHRPNTTFETYLVTDRSDGAQPFYRADALREVSSTSREVAASQSLMYRGSDEVTEIHVESITLDDLLDKHGVERIDLLSMDIEEHEPAALVGFDIERFGPELVVIEAHESTGDAIMTYFTDHGYERIDKYLPYDDVNWYFMPGEDSGNMGSLPPPSGAEDPAQSG